MPRKIQPPPRRLPRSVARQASPVSRALSRPARIGITAFVAFNLFAVVAWCIPFDSPLIARCRDVARPYLIFTGLFQKWDMFAPDPSKLNNFVAAVVTYRNGESSLWTFPRMEHLGYVDKYFKERYRKYANDCLRLDTNAELWPDAARYIARLNRRPLNPPAAIDLVRYWSIVPPPAANGEEPPTLWSQHTFFRWIVAPGDLE